MGEGIEMSSIKTQEITKDDLIPEGMWGRGAIKYDSGFWLGAAGMLRPFFRMDYR